MKLICNKYDKCNNYIYKNDIYVFINVIFFILRGELYDSNVWILLIYILVLMCVL